MNKTNLNTQTNCVLFGHKVITFFLKLIFIIFLSLFSLTVFMSGDLGGGLGDGPPTNLYPPMTVLLSICHSTSFSSYHYLSASLSSSCSSPACLYVTVAVSNL